MTMLKIDLEAVASTLFHNYAKAHRHEGGIPESAREGTEWDVGVFDGACEIVSAWGLDGDGNEVRAAVEIACEQAGPIPSRFSRSAYPVYASKVVPLIVAELEELFTLDMTMPGWQKAVGR